MLINWFQSNLSEMYYCDMESEQIEVKTEKVILTGNREYFYTVNPVEIVNALGIIIATCTEYSITNFSNENYKLHKTKEGNWYDLPEENKSADKAIIMSLKLALNSKDNKELL